MKVAVVGGGPAGCAAAYTLRKAGHHVALFEAQDGVGRRTARCWATASTSVRGRCF